MSHAQVTAGLNTNTWDLENRYMEHEGPLFAHQINRIRGRTSLNNLLTPELDIFKESHQPVVSMRK